MAVGSSEWPEEWLSEWTTVVCLIKLITCRPSRITIVDLPPLMFSVECLTVHAAEQVGEMDAAFSADGCSDEGWREVSADWFDGRPSKIKDQFNHEYKYYLWVVRVSSGVLLLWEYEWWLILLYLLFYLLLWCHCCSRDSRQLQQLQTLRWGSCSSSSLLRHRRDRLFEHLLKDQDWFLISVSLQTLGGSTWPQSIPTTFFWKSCKIQFKDIFEIISNLWILVWSLQIVQWNIEIHVARRNEIVWFLQRTALWERSKINERSQITDLSCWFDFSSILSPLI